VFPGISQALRDSSPIIQLVNLQADVVSNQVQLVTDVLSDKRNQDLRRHWTVAIVVIVMVGIVVVITGILYWRYRVGRSHDDYDDA